jgi:hypothetical protein
VDLRCVFSFSSALVLTDQIGLTLPDTPPLLHFAQRLDGVGWTRERV